MALSGGWPHQVRLLNKAKAPRGGEPWTREEEAKLIDGYHKGCRPEELAASHQRTPAACVSRLVWVGVLIADGGSYWERPATPYVTVRQMIDMAKDRSK